MSSIDPLDSSALRDVVGHYPSGVTVVTAMAGDAPVGFSCQSFHSLSLDPPMIVIMPGRASTTWPQIRAAGKFCVNILAADQGTLCRTFSTVGTDRFAGVRWAPGPGGAPVLDGASAWIDCDLDAEYDGGDHTIALGRVKALGSDESRPPLVFHRGLFRMLAD